MRSLGIHHLAVHAHAAGVEAVTAFYREIVGLKELTRHLEPDGSLRSVWLSLTRTADPAGGFLAVEKGSMFGPAMIALKISSTDRAALIADLKRQKVQIVKESRWSVYVDDPAGNHVAFSHHPHDLL